MLLADSALAADAGVVSLTVKDAGHDLFYCVLLSLSSHCGVLGIIILLLNASYLLFVKVSFLFFLFSLFLAFCWLLHRGNICFIFFRCVFSQLHFRLVLFIAIVVQKRLSYLALCNQF